MSNHRTICFENYDEMCAACPSTSENTTIEVHHIDGHSNNNNGRNLIPLCEECHNKVEAECWTDEIDAEIELANPTLRWLVEKKRAYSPNTDGSDRPKRIVGFTDSDMEEIRYLVGLVQQEVVNKKIKKNDAVLWAIRNEIERLEE